MHNVEDMITSNKDDYPKTIVLTYTNKKGDYKLSRNARVASLMYVLSPLQGATNELYVFKNCLVSNEQSRMQVKVLAQGFEFPTLFSIIGAF
jgi:hypothetical protein